MKNDQVSGTPADGRGGGLPVTAYVGGNNSLCLQCKSPPKTHASITIEKWLNPTVALARREMRLTHKCKMKLLDLEDRGAAIYYRFELFKPTSHPASSPQ